MKLLAVLLLLGLAVACSDDSTPPADPPRLTGEERRLIIETIAGCPQGCLEEKPGCSIKGNISQTSGEKIYHVPGGRFYDATVIVAQDGERWFCTGEEATANGWRRSQR